MGTLIARSASCDRLNGTGSFKHRSTPGSVKTTPTSTRGIQSDYSTPGQNARGTRDPGPVSPVPGRGFSKLAPGTSSPSFAFLSASSVPVHSTTFELGKGDSVMKYVYEIRDTLTRTERQRIRRWAQKFNEYSGGMVQVMFARNTISVFFDGDQSMVDRNGFTPGTYVRYAMIAAGRTFYAYRTRVFA